MTLTLADMTHKVIPIGVMTRKSLEFLLRQGQFELLLSVDGLSRRGMGLCGEV